MSDKPWWEEANWEEVLHTGIVAREKAILALRPERDQLRAKVAELKALLASETERWTNLVGLAFDAGQASRDARIAELEAEVARLRATRCKWCAEDAAERSGLSKGDAECENCGAAISPVWCARCHATAI